MISLELFMKYIRNLVLGSTNTAIKRAWKCNSKSKMSLIEER